MDKLVQTVPQLSTPIPLRRRHASLLQDSVDPLLSSPALKGYRPEAVDSSVLQWVESVSGSEPYSSWLPRRQTYP